MQTVAPESTMKVPIAQRVHAVRASDSVAASYCPGAHSSHSVIPAAPVIVPGLQFVQAVLEVIEVIEEED